ncbi:MULTISPECIES: hypothetical protein [unclassified Caballeronia]|uniref:hypothetical protein n=1 Tax=unclassified Caballeronia TaxID=2646786 RepID=UPI002865535A|nr:MULTISPECIES: hypothetical protein [unclassified Caballeronia]MDR5740883.1 hypothetical protein [Caballeronia sp. LZ016]MDR5808596.1 hypothetical protein [Caballeronia sp. LZ019]
MIALPSSRLSAAFTLLAIGVCAHAECPGYVETDAGSAFDIAAIIKDSGSPQTALDKVRGAVSKINAGGGCAIFANKRACEETLALARKAIVALQACSSTASPKGAARG